MDKYACYCGLYCLNCAVKATVEPAAGVLYAAMRRAGFEEVIEFMPNGKEFLPMEKTKREEQ